ncbi:MAG: FG-GAP-like repeat-containing protein, partial [Acidobacteriota bacterium]
GLYAYVYRLDLRQLAGITALPCIFELSLDFGPVTALDYDGSGNPDQVFVVTAGGLGSVGPASAEQTGGTVTFTFAPPVCAGSYPGGGETSYFFGLASTRAPRHVNAQIRDTLGGTATLDARVPEAPGLAPAPLTVFHRLRIRPEQLRLWKSFRERYGERLRVDWNPVTGTPHRIEGAALELPEPPTDNTIEPLARRFLLTHRELLRIDPEQLGLAKIEHLTPERTDAGTGTWQIFYHQVYRDLPVDGGSARMTIRDGRVTSFGSDFRPGVAPLATEPELSTGAALQRVRELDPRYLRRKPVASRLIVFPEAAGDQVRYHLAWDLTMPEVLEPRDLVDPAAPDRGVRTPTGEPPQPLERIPAQWRYLVDAHTGAVIERQNLMRYEDVSGTVTGPVHPEVPDDPPETRPLPDLTVTVTQGLTTTTDETDATGSYLIPGLAAGAATLESHFEGPHLRVWNNETADPDATHATSVTAPATHDWDWASDDPSPDDVETNAFWHIHWIRSWFLQGTPFDVTPDPDPMEVFVRDGEYCNAGAGSSGISFGGGVPGSCEDFSLCSDIAYHEYTHRIVAKVYDDAGVSLPYADETGAMNEGWADYFGSTTTEDSGHGEGCYGGRDIEPDRRYPDDWVGEVHSDGLIFSGALWDLRTALGTAFVDELAMWGMRDATTGFSEYLGAILGWDDDPAFSPDPAADNDPTNGTPNIDAICHAYWDLHGVFHPDCVGHTDLPVAILTAPSPIDFNLADPAAPSLPIEGTALGSSAAPLQSFVLEYAHDGAPATWLTAGVTLTGGGTTPVNAGALGDLALGGLADGLYLLRLTVTDTAANSASAIAAFYLDHALMTGWPQAMEAHFYGSPAIADLDPAYPGLEVAAAASDGSFHVWHADGTAAPGWPRSVSFSRSAPAVADLDADGTLEVVQSTAYGSVYAWSQDGTSLPGWPVSMTFPGQDYEYSTAALGDLDGDGDLEVVVGSTNAEVHAWHHDGTAVAGWPVSVGDWVQASPTLADLDGDGLPEVIFGSRDGQVHVYRGDGTVLAGWPQAIAGAPQVTCSAAAGDLDGDGDFEVVVGTADFDTVFTSVSGRVHAFHADGTAVTGWPQDLTILVFRPASVDLADLDGDGDLEVVVQSNDDNVQVWNGDGTPVAGWPPTGPGGAFYEFTVSSPAIADLDGDGDQEVTAEASYSTVDGFSRY